MTSKHPSKTPFDQRLAFIRFGQERIDASQRPEKCPKCEHSPVAEILYGLPDFSPALDASIEAGETSIGGCCRTGLDDPAWRCSQCGQRIWKTGTKFSDSLKKRSEIYQQRTREISSSEDVNSKIKIDMW